MTPFGLALDEKTQQFLLTGTTLVNGNANEAAITRVSLSGVTDSTFGTSGETILPFGPSSEGDIIELLSNGQILVGGDAGVSYITRLNPDGSIDSSFGTNGVTAFAGDSARPKTISAISVDSAGNVYTCGPNSYGPPGSGTTASPAGVLVGRFTAEGAPDTSFGQYGDKEVDFGYRAVWLGIPPHGGGSFAVSASQPGTLTIASVTDTGALDTSFNGSGLESGPLANLCYLYPRGLAQSDGKLVLVGSGGGEFFMATGATGPTGIAVTRVAGSSELQSTQASSSGGSGGGSLGTGTFSLLGLIALLRKRYQIRVAWPDCFFFSKTGMKASPITNPRVRRPDGRAPRSSYLRASRADGRMQ